MTDFAQRVGAPPPEGEPDAGFAAQITSFVTDEATRLLEGVAALRRDAQEVTRVARAIGVDLPAELTVLAEMPEPVIPERPAAVERTVAAPAPVAPAPAAEQVGTSSRSSRAGDQNRAVILRTLTERGPMVLGELVSAVGIGQPSVSKHLKALRESGDVRTVKVEGRRGNSYEAVGGGAEMLPEVDPAALAAVRDFVCSTKRAFAPGDVVEATELAEGVVRDALRVLIHRCVIRYVGFDDLELYEYEPPSGPGPNAATRGADSNGAGRSQPVTGTGGGKVSGDPGVRKLVQQCERLGATVRRSGGGHVSVETPAGKRILIPSTPRNEQQLKGVRARLRQAGLAV